MLKLDFLKKLGLLSAGAFAFTKPEETNAAEVKSDPLVGLWQMTIAGSAGTYRYLYSISPGAWVATGNIDEGFSQFKYSPSMGAYVRLADGSFRYTEKGWVFDRQGTNVGTFLSVGTFKLTSSQNMFRGPGTFTQFDMHGKATIVEPFTATATKVAV